MFYSLYNFYKERFFPHTPISYKDIYLLYNPNGRTREYIIHSAARSGGSGFEGDFGVFQAGEMGK